MAKGKKTLTTAFGIPVGNDLHSLTAGEGSPILICSGIFSPLPRSPSTRSPFSSQTGAPQKPTAT